jgi:Family of unknown function (DUF7009)
VKVRIKGNSLRLRIPRSELEKLVRHGRIEETISFGPDEGARQIWALEHSASLNAATVRFAPPEIAVAFPSSEVERWAPGEEVGIYASIDLGSNGTLDLIVEKDFACLHGSADENRDAFPNPYAAA